MQEILSLFSNLLLLFMRNGIIIGNQRSLIFSKK